MDQGLVPRGPDPTGYSARLAQSDGVAFVYDGSVFRLAISRLLPFPMRILAGAAMLLLASAAQAECALDQARWAYDEENRILRLCVKIQASDQLRCTTFPHPVVIDPFSL